MIPSMEIAKKARMTVKAATRIANRGHEDGDSQRNTDRGYK